MKPTPTVEYSIYRVGEGRPTYELECDGRFIGEAPSEKVAHLKCEDHARRHNHMNAGLTEVYGRNRQFVIRPRKGWKTWKGEPL